MQGPLGKLIPLSTLLVVLGYLCWPHFETPPTPEGPSTTLPKVTDSMLRPGQPPASVRDPFGDSVRFEIGEIDESRSAKRTPGPRSKDKTATDASRTTGTTPLKKVESADTATPPPRQTAPVASAGTTALATRGAAPQTRTSASAVSNEPTTGLVLNATLLFGDERIAMINGRAYKQGDSVESVGADEPPVLRQIHHHSVIVSRAGQVATLHYPNTSSQPTARQGAAPPGGTRNVSSRRPAAPARPSVPGAPGAPQR
jgi:hypothetical protein